MIDAAPVLFGASITFFINLGGKVMFFELCVHDGHAPVRLAMLSGDSSCIILGVLVHLDTCKVIDLISLIDHSVQISGNSLEV